MTGVGKKSEENHFFIAECEATLRYEKRRGILGRLFPDGSGYRAV